MRDIMTTYIYEIADRIEISFIFKLPSDKN